MKIKYSFLLLALLTLNLAHAENFGNLAENDEFFCNVDNILPKKNANEDGCSFFRFDKKSEKQYMGYATKQGKIVIPPIYQTVSDTTYVPKFLIVTNHENKWGMLDKQNSVIIPIEFDIVQKTESPNLFVVTKGNWRDENSNALQGVYNAKGDLIVPVKYSMGIGIIKGKTSDYITVEIDEKYGIMNDKGEFLYLPNYSFEEIAKIEEKLRVK